ncbi:hypothetical protein K469DRAFT_729030 [Zopfia rhizophila CBS 207.26]|uniref:Rhodopsin domain-containing protein n=1 Tax=Zopfia rhizophila CBS 207.26 TaxID=1314779 RepID=A0A6A6DU42_9PEZI|nr:hypothetical protein K469DRAFT_729030 [Zopfia rhizophila CBS 207.26]
MKYDNPGRIIAVSVVLEVAVTCVALRFYSRRLKKSSTLVSDWLILVALLFATALTVTEIYAIAYPLSATLGDPQAAIGRFKTVKDLESVFLLLGITASGFVNTSVSFLSWNLFAEVAFGRFLKCWIAIIMGWTVAFALNPEEYQQYCEAFKGAGFAYIGSDIGTDLITLLIPIPIVISLQLPTTRKILVLATFMIGALSVGASIAKAYIYIISMLGADKEDGILLLTGFSIWNLAEVQVGIIAACGLTLRPILSHIFPVQRVSAMIDRLHNTKHDSKNTTLPSFVRAVEPDEVS